MKRLAPLCILLTIVGVRPATCAPKPNVIPKKPPVPVVTRLTERLYRVGTAIVDTSLHKVTVNGEINMASGPVEYLAVTPRGKTYESLLRLNVQPLYLQVALYLAGLHSRNVLSYQGQHKIPKGDPMTITVEWHDAFGRRHTVRAEDLLRLQPGNHIMPHHYWVFTGSRVSTNGYLADLTGSIIAVWHDPAALIDNPLPTGADDGWVVNTKLTPRQGTPVTVYFTAVPSPTAAH